MAEILHFNAGVAQLYNSIRKSVYPSNTLGNSKAYILSSKAGHIHLARYLVERIKGTSMEQHRSQVVPHVYIHMIRLVAKSIWRVRKERGLEKQ
jgi:hypothetical protein